MALSDAAAAEATSPLPNMTDNNFNASTPLTSIAAASPPRSPLEGEGAESSNGDDDANANTTQQIDETQLNLDLTETYDMSRSDTINTFALDTHGTNGGNISVQRGSTVLRQSSIAEDLIPEENEEENEESKDSSPTRNVNSSSMTIPKVATRKSVGVSSPSSTGRTPSSTSSRSKKKKTQGGVNPCLNPSNEVNARLDTQVEVKVYPCNNNSQSGGKKKFTQFTVKPEGVIIQGNNRHRTSPIDLGNEYATQIGRKLQRYELSDNRACQLLVTTHAKSFWVVPAPEAFSRHSGTCRLLGDRKHPLAPHTLQVGDFLRVGSVGVVVIETHNGQENRILSEDKIQKIMKDTTNSNSGFLDLGETDNENSEDSVSSEEHTENEEDPVCYMCFDDENKEDNPLITPCKCRGDTRYVHVNCLRKWHTAEADNQICFLSSVDATCSVCKSTFKSDFKLKDGRLVKLFKSSLEPPYVSLLVATKHEMAQRLFNTRFQLSFKTLMKADGKNVTRPLLLGRSSGSDMVLDYRTVSARHATIKFKNGEFIFTDAGSSNGSYLYLRRPVELTPSQPVQFRLGRSMISMKVVSKWNRRLLRAVRRTGNSSSSNVPANTGDDHSVGSNEEDVRINYGKDGAFTKNLPRRSRESILNSLPDPGQLSQQSPQHLDLLHALAYPAKKIHDSKLSSNKRKDVAEDLGILSDDEVLSKEMGQVAIEDSEITAN